LNWRTQDTGRASNVRCSCAHLLLLLLCTAAPPALLLLLLLMMMMMMLVVAGAVTAMCIAYNVSVGS